MTDDADLLTTDQIAPIVGLTPDSTRTSHWRAERRRREGKPLPTDMPAPDRRFGGTPVWLRSSVEAWKAARG